jgi:hypothetical protein
VGLVVFGTGRGRTRAQIRRLSRRRGCKIGVYIGLGAAAEGKGRERKMREQGIRPARSSEERAFVYWGFCCWANCNATQRTTLEKSEPGRVRAGKAFGLGCVAAFGGAERECVGACGRLFDGLPQSGASPRSRHHDKQPQKVNVDKTWPLSVNQCKSNG